MLDVNGDRSVIRWYQEARKYNQVQFKYNLISPLLSILHFVYLFYYFFDSEQFPPTFFFIHILFLLL